jgi:LmbE family N-acetylglucosaminyl deacetylase
MNKRSTLLVVLAHPDDQLLGFGGTLAEYAAEGVETYLVIVTREERGSFGSLGKRATAIRAVASQRLQSLTEDQQTAL